MDELNLEAVILDQTSMIKEIDLGYPRDAIKSAEQILKAKANIVSPTETPFTKLNKSIVSEEIDKVQEEIQQSLGKKANVKLVRSNRQTKLFIRLNGNLSATDDILKKIHQLLITLKQENKEN